MNTTNRKAVIYIVIAACLWGMMPIPVKLSAYDPLWVAWVRTAGNAILVIACFHRSLLRFGRPRLIELGVAAVFFGSLLTTTLGMRFTSAANAVVFGFVSPFAGLAVEILMGRRPTAKEVLLMGVLLAGVIVINGGVSAPSSGDLLALASGLLWGSAFPKAQSLKDRLQVAVLWQQLFGVLFIPFIALGMRGTIIPPVPSLPQALWLSALAGVGGFAYVLHTKASQTDTVKAHINLSLQVFQAVTAAGLGYLLLSEPFGIQKALGTVIVIAAAIRLVKGNE